MEITSKYGFLDFWEGANSKLNHIVTASWSFLWRLYKNFKVALKLVCDTFKKEHLINRDVYVTREAGSNHTVSKNSKKLIDVAVIWIVILFDRKHGY